MARVHVPHSSHWGAFEAEVADGTVIAIHPYRHDPDPSPLLGNIVDGLRDRARIAQPMVHAGSVARTNGVWPSPGGGGAGWGGSLTDSLRQQPPTGRMQE